MQRESGGWFRAEHGFEVTTLDRVNRSHRKTEADSV
jgi:hypothetical protein